MLNNKQVHHLYKCDVDFILSNLSDFIKSHCDDIDINIDISIDNRDIFMDLMLGY